MAKTVRFRDPKSNRFFYYNVIGKSLKVTREMGGDCSCGVFVGRSQAHSGDPHLHWCDTVSMDILLPTGEEVKRVYYDDVEVVE